MNQVAMKTKPSSHLLIRGHACFLFALPLISCQTSTPTATEVPKTATRTHWVKVSSQLPTYYPRGMSANAPADHWSGEWVDTDDERGTRYFIPFSGLGDMNRQVLIDDALSARSERKLAKIAAEDEEILIRNIRNMALFGPPVFVGGLAAGMAGGDMSQVNVHQLQKNWDTARNPQ